MALPVNFDKEPQSKPKLLLEYFFLRNCNSGDTDLDINPNCSEMERKRQFIEKGGAGWCSQKNDIRAVKELSLELASI